jgi:hypothetical protein
MILPTKRDAAAIRQMAGKLQQSRGAGVHNSPGAMVTAQSFKRTRLNDPPNIPIIIIGKIVATGPLGSEANYTDERYWVKLQYVASNDSTLAALIVLADETWTPPPPLVVTATNLAEYLPGSHGLAAGAIVNLLRITDAGGNAQYIFTAGGSGASSIPVLLSVGSGGAYTGREQVWASGAWSEKSGATDLTCVNLCETTGGHTSPVDAGAIVLATKVGGTYFFNWPTNAKYKA